MKHKSFKINKSVFHEIISESVKRVLSEVRYIDPSVQYKKGGREHYKEEPLRNDETIRVYHGLGSIEDAVLIAKYGTSGKDFHARKYSYENGMNPHGLFVTVSHETFPDFASGSKRRAAIEFSCKVRDLDFPVWNGQGTFFIQGSNPQPFSSKTERDKQRERYYNDAITDDNPRYVRYSDNPALAKSLMNSAEFQALFVGDLNPNMIKRIWVQEGDGSTHWEKYSVKTFLKKYGDIKISDYIERYHHYPQNRLYLPNEDFTSIEDAARRLYGSDTTPSDVEDLVQAFENPSYGCENIRQLFWPKQIIQYKGEDYFRQYFSRFYDNPEYSQYTNGEREQLPKVYQRYILAAQNLTDNRLPIIFGVNGKGKENIDRERAERVLSDLKQQLTFLIDIRKQYGDNISVEVAKEIYANNRNTVNKDIAVELYSVIRNGNTLLELGSDISQQYSRINKELKQKKQLRIEKVSIADGIVTVNWNQLTLDEWGCTEKEERTTEQFPIDSPKAKTFALKLKQNPDLMRRISVYGF